MRGLLFHGLRSRPADSGGANQSANVESIAVFTMTDEQAQLGIPPPPLRVMDDYGPVGAGASQAHTVLAENGQEYIVKGPSLVPSHPHVAANEYVAARLGQAIGLPILDFTTVALAGDLFFASALMPPGTFHNQTTEDLFDRCENRDLRVMRSPGPSQVRPTRPTSVELNPGRPAPIRSYWNDDWNDGAAVRVLTVPRSPLI
jgi:hypothetical protein